MCRLVQRGGRGQFSGEAWLSLRSNKARQRRTVLGEERLPRVVQRRGKRRHPAEIVPLREIRFQNVPPHRWRSRAAHNRSAPASSGTRRGTPAPPSVARPAGCAECRPANDRAAATICIRPRAAARRSRSCRRRRICPDRPSATPPATVIIACAARPVTRSWMTSAWVTEAGIRVARRVGQLDIELQGSERARAVEHDREVALLLVAEDVGAEAPQIRQEIPADVQRAAIAALHHAVDARRSIQRLRICQKLVERIRHRQMVLRVQVRAIEQYGHVGLTGTDISCPPSRSQRCDAGSRTPCRRMCRPAGPDETRDRSRLSGSRNPPA